MERYVHFLPHVNATLNALATMFLLAGIVCIRSRREVAHRRAMIAAFATSVLFLTSYLVYHGIAGSKRFPDYPSPVIQTLYRTILLTHIVLAAMVPFLAVAAIYLGLKDRRAQHRKVVRWAFPIWLYVSVSGVFVYLMLYQLYPPLASEL